MSTVHPEETEALSPPYTHPFRQWDKRSWIRSKHLSEGTLDDGTPFPLSLVALARHPLVAQNPVRQEQVLAFRALAHLEFTTLLELEHINPVCGALAQGQSRVPLSLEERQDALRIYCDEGGHALIVEHLAQRLESHHGVDRRLLGRPGFDTALRELMLEHAQVSPELMRTFFVAISETLITQLLGQVPKDVTVASAVRAVIRAHASDEAHHREFFRWYLPRLWQELTPPEQEQIGRVLPEMLWAFLGPDEQVDLRILRAVGFAPREAMQILEETYPPEEVLGSVLHAARPTLKLFAQAGVMRAPSIRRWFLQRELWLEP